MRTLKKKNTQKKTFVLMKRWIYSGVNFVRHFMPTMLIPFGYFIIIIIIIINQFTIQKLKVLLLFGVATAVPTKNKSFYQITLNLLKTIIIFKGEVEILQGNSY